MLKIKKLGISWPLGRSPIPTNINKTPPPLISRMLKGKKTSEDSVIHNGLAFFFLNNNLLKIHQECPSRQWLDFHLTPLCPFTLKKSKIKRDFKKKTNKACEKNCD